MKDQRKASPLPYEKSANMTEWVLGAIEYHLGPRGKSVLTKYFDFVTSQASERKTNLNAVSGRHR
jgi:hypothetical protein